MKLDIKKYDSDNMRDLLLSLPSQFSYEPEVVGSLPSPQKFTNVVITGLGGSAIGGEIISYLVQQKCPIPVIVNRNYTLGAFVGSSTLVIASSYSGETEETLSAYEQATKAGATVICITSGGTIKERATSRNQCLLIIPGGLPPRCAIGYSLNALFVVFNSLGWLSPLEFVRKDVVSFTEKLTKRYAQANESNKALKIATSIKGKIPIIYGTNDTLAPVANRWKGQFCENAKVLAFANLIPEMNHNEIVGWTERSAITEKTASILLSDKDDLTQNTFRLQFTSNIIKDKTNVLLNIRSEGNNIIERLLSLIILGDWVSYYLAIISKVSPTPILMINKLKKKLKQLKK